MAEESLRNPHGFAAFPGLKDAGYTEQVMQDLWRLSAADLANLVKTKKVSARRPRRPASPGSTPSIRASTP